MNAIKENLAESCIPRGTIQAPLHAKILGNNVGHTNIHLKYILTKLERKYDPESISFKNSTELDGVLTLKHYGQQPWPKHIVQLNTVTKCGAIVHMSRKSIHNCIT